MAVSIDKKFRFVSPGVFINEIDNSQLPKQAAPIGVLGLAANSCVQQNIIIGCLVGFIE
jgi:hypothetical protein